MVGGNYLFYYCVICLFSNFQWKMSWLCDALHLLLLINWTNMNWGWIFWTKFWQYELLNTFSYLNLTEREIQPKAGHLADRSCLINTICRQTFYLSLMFYQSIHKTIIFVSTKCCPIFLLFYFSVFSILQWKHKRPFQC